MTLRLEILPHPWDVVALFAAVLTVWTLLVVACFRVSEWAHARARGGRR